MPATSNNKISDKTEDQAQSGVSRGGSSMQHAEAGRKGGQSRAAKSNKSPGGASKSQATSMQGGAHEQHVKAGQQSHKNQ